MDLDAFRSQILIGLVSNDQNVQKQAEENFILFLSQNPCLTLQLLISNSNSNDQSSLISITLLGSAALLIHDRLMKIEDIQFHHNFQSSLLLLLQNTSLSPLLLYNISFVISRYSKIYLSNWPSLLGELLQIIQYNDNSSFAIDCLTYCIMNNSILFNDQVLEASIHLIQNILCNTPNLNLQFFSVMKLIFALYQYDGMSNITKSNLKEFSNTLISVSFEESDESLHNRYMIELSNFCDTNIDFFESSFNSLIDLLCSKIDSQQNSQIVNSSILILKDIFSNIKYVNFFETKFLEIYKMLVKIISIKLPEAEIYSDEGESSLNESNTISIAKDTINSIARNYGGINESYIYFLTSFTEQQFDDFGLFISNFIAFGCVINEIIKFIIPDLIISDILPIYKIGFASQDINCRYRSIVSLKKVLKAFSNYPDELNIDSQSIISLIFETLSKENISSNITALLSTLKTCLNTFDDYHDNIGNIILLLEQNFKSFTIKQQLIVITCYSYCASLCTKNDIFNDLMLQIYNKLITVLRNGCQDFTNDLFFVCLDSILDFDNIVPPESFIEISFLVLKFIASFNPNINQNSETSANTMMDALSYKQIDIINRALRILIQTCPRDQILTLSNQILQPIFLLALSDVKSEKFSFDENKSELQTNYEIIRCPEERSWICYSKNSISNIYEALHTIHSIICKFPEIVDPYIQQLLDIIGKWINECFSFTLVFKCTKILSLILNNEKMKLPEMEAFLLNIFLKVILAFDLIDDQDTESTINFIQLYNKLFDFIGTNFNSNNSLLIVSGHDDKSPNPINLIFKLYSKWEQLHQISLSSSNDLRSDDIIKDYDQVEVEIGHMFEPIFKYFSYQQVREKIMPILFQVFPIETINANYFITSTFIGAYSSFSVYSSFCTDEEVVKIGTLFSKIFLNRHGSNISPYAIKSASESILKIANSGRISFEFLSYIIKKIEQVIQIKKEVIDSFVIPQILILIENIINNKINIILEDLQKSEFVTKLITLLLNCLPVNCLVINDFTYQSAESLLFLLSVNHPIFSDLHNLALICCLALLFILIHKPPKSIITNLRTFVKSVLYIEQGQPVYNEILNFPLSSEFRKKIINEVSKELKKMSHI